MVVSYILFFILFQIDAQENNQNQVIRGRVIDKPTRFSEMLKSNNKGEVLQEGKSFL